MKSRKLCRDCPHRRRTPGTVLNLSEIGIGEDESHQCHVNQSVACEGSLQRLDLLRDGRARVEKVPRKLVGVKGDCVGLIVRGRV